MNAIESQQICAACEQAIRHGAGRLENVAPLIKKIISEELWKERKVENGKVVKLKSFRDLITTKPFNGWGADPTKIEAIIRDDAEALALWHEAMATKRGPKPKPSDNFVYNVNETAVIESREKGNSRAYTVSRLKKQRPDLFEDVKAGNLSANAAAIKAGWRKQKTPYENLCHWWAKADGAARARFRLFLDGDGD